MSPDDPRHGEERGYYAHRKAGQKPCDACTVAHRASQKRRTLQLMSGTGNWVPALGTQRRIQALVAIGWRLEDIAEAAGYARTHEALSTILYRQTRVRAQTAERLSVAYERLSGTPGPSSRVRVNAHKRGWAPPLAWLDIDDPDEVPDAGKPVKRPSAGRPIAHTLEDFDWLVSNGESEETALARLGITRYAIEAARRRSEVA